MSTSLFPASKDTFTNPTATSTTNNPSLSAGQTLQNDALSALETKVGITASADATSLDYKVSILQEQASTLYTDTGLVNAYVITPTTVFTAYANGQTFSFLPANTNTGASTLNVNGLGTKAIQFQGGALVTGNLSVSAIATVVYNGTSFQLVNPAAQVPRQNIASNTTLASPRMATGWSYVTGTGGEGELTLAITYPFTFTTAPVPHIAPIGTKDSSNPSLISDLTGQHTYLMSIFAPTTTGFTAQMDLLSGNTTSGRRYGFGWQAIGN